MFKDYYSISKLTDDVEKLKAKCTEAEANIDKYSKAKKADSSRAQQLKSKLKLIDKKLQSLTLESSKTSRELDMLS